MQTRQSKLKYITTTGCKPVSKKMPESANFYPILLCHPFLQCSYHAFGRPFDVIVKFERVS